MEGFYEEVIGSRSFSSVWYWIVFALVWTRATHKTLGAPYEDARLAHYEGGQAQVDFETTIDIGMRKTIAIFDAQGTILTALACFLLATLFVLGFVFGIQFMQAGFLLVFPLAIAGCLTLRLAYRLQAEQISGEPLYRAYVWHRREKQAIGAVSIMFTTYWGVAQILFTPYA